MKKRNPFLTSGLLLSALVFAFILLGYFWTPFDPMKMNGAAREAAPSLTHLMGTDRFGRDILSRVMKGAGSTFFVAFGTVLIGTAAGTLIGALTGYFGGWLDELLMRVSDALSAFPSFLLALVLVSVLGTGRRNVLLALGIVFIPSYARIVRTEFKRASVQNYVKSAHLMGASTARILFVHILPNTWQVLLSAVTIGFNNAVLAEAAMSYLGIGVSPDEASLGYMLCDSQAYLVTTPWYALGAGLVIILLLLGVGLIAEGLQRKDLV